MRDSIVHTLRVSILVFIVCVGASCHMQPSHADAWTDDEVAVARLTISEADFARYGGENRDHSAITAILKRRAHRNGRTVAEQIERDHRSHTSGTGPRRWLAGLDASMQRPDGWPEERVHWDPTGVRQFTRTLELARWNLDDEAADPCGGRASTWIARERPTFSEAMNRRIRERRAAMFAAGHTPVDCGSTVNEFWRYAR